MSSSDSSYVVRIMEGDLLKSGAQTLVNTVNTVGVMGKGVALAFKRRYPDMFRDYVRRCDGGQVKLGRPYVYAAADHLIVNFPTKAHWRAVSRLDDIVAGLNFLEAHYRQWGITSIAVPPLGCGNGQLEWSVVGPTLHRHLSRLSIPVELYAPHGSAGGEQQLSFLGGDEPKRTQARFVEPEWVALIAILHELELQRYHWPVGRVLFQKLAYFATQAGLPTRLRYEPASCGPYSDALKPMIARLQNNGLAMEERRGQMFEVRVGPTYEDAAREYRTELEEWAPIIQRTYDLMARMNSQRAEVAASVHFAAGALQERLERTPTSTEVVQAVEEWKMRRQPFPPRPEIFRALVALATRGWVHVEPDDAVAPYAAELVNV